MMNNKSLPFFPGAHYVDRSALGVLKIAGATRLDLLHRMSTQDVLPLGPGEGAATVLTSDIGRIIDRLLIYTTADTVYAVTGEGNAQNIGRYLMRFVFFNDDFQLKDISAETAIYGVYGDDAPARLLATGFPEVDMPLHHWRQADISGVTAYLHRTDPIGAHGYFVMAAQTDSAAVRTALEAAGISPMAAETFETWRVRAGVPRYGRELTLDYIPLETGLWDDVSFSKGCYIGQEIIARMESRGRLAKRLVQLAGAGPVTVGSDIKANGRKVGVVTSAASGPEGHFALGYVKTAALDDVSSSLAAGDVALDIVSN